MVIIEEITHISMHAYIIINNDEQTVMTHSISYLISSLKIVHTTPPQEIFVENKTPAPTHEQV